MTGNRMKSTADLLAKVRVERSLANDPRKRTLSRRGKQAEIRRIAQNPNIIQDAKEIAAIDITIADHEPHLE